MNALKILATICEQYAKIFDILFNGKKSLLIIYKCTRSQPPNLGIVINNVRVPRVDEVIFGRHYMCEDIYKFNASNCVSDFNRQSNMFLANVKHANSYIRMRIAICRVWQVTWTTHCVLLPHFVLVYGY